MRGLPGWLPELVGAEAGLSHGCHYSIGRCIQFSFSVWFYYALRLSLARSHFRGAPAAANVVADLVFNPRSLQLPRFCLYTD